VTAPQQPGREQEIRARASAATPGPWTVKRDEPTLSLLVVSDDATLDINFGYVGNRPESNAEFVAHAREDVDWLLAENARLRTELTSEREKNERDQSDLIDERDVLQDWLDKFAQAVAPEEVIGEHSSGNNPWANAFELVTPAAEVKRLRARVAELEADRDAAVAAAVRRALEDAAERQRKFVLSDDFVCDDWEAALTVVDLIDPAVASPAPATGEEAAR
jgi:hypothetical protein